MNGLQVTLEQGAPIPLDAAFDCAPGEVHALVGPSGSGKSTILRAIAGTYRPHGGHVAVNGETWFSSAADIALPPHRRPVGFVFQSYALFPHLTALDNLKAAMAHRPAAEHDEKARALLARMHLEGLADRRPAELSGGEQQRVAVARALARDPRVLLLDEPFSAVDRPTRQRLYREIADLRRDLAMPVVLVTHDLAEAILLADRLTVLNRGRTLQTGTPETVTTRPATTEVARLVDVRNVFEGRIVGPTTDGGSLIECGGVTLRSDTEVARAPGATVTWAIPDGYLVMHRGDRSEDRDENLLHGCIEQVLVIGAVAHLRFRPDAGPGPLEFSIAAHVARRQGFRPGAVATVRLLADGIHPIPA